MAQPSGSSPATGPPSPLARWTIAAAAAALVGTFGPWISGPLGITVSGLSIAGLSDARLMAAGAVIVALLANDYRRRGRAHDTDVVMVIGGVGVWAALHDVRQINARPLATAGWGLELDLLAFAAIALLGAALLVHRLAGRR